MRKDQLHDKNPLYKRYTAREKRAVLSEFSYGWNQKFELECCMDSNINVKYIANPKMKSYTMSIFRELVYLGQPIEVIKPILDPSFSESKVNLLLKCIKKHIDIESLANEDYQYIKQYYEKHNNSI